MTGWTCGVTASEQDGDFVVSVRDLPEVVTSGSSMTEALDLAADALAVAVAGRMADDMDLPPPSTLEPGEVGASIPAPLSAKASIYSALKAAKLSTFHLARLLDRDEASVRRLLDPRRGAKLEQPDQAARALGGRLLVGFEQAWRA